MTEISFTAHNIRLDDGSQTKAEIGVTMDQQPIFRAAERLIRLVFPRRVKTTNTWLRPLAKLFSPSVTLADIGCLEGGFSVEFARMGLDVTGLEVRESNMSACNYVKSRVNLPNLKFVKDDAWNIGLYGPFDIIFCAGLFYHVDKPREFMRLLASNSRKMLFLDTHFAPPEGHTNISLSPVMEHEGMLGRWYDEFASEANFKAREDFRWASWDNKKSFWAMREHLLQLIHESGFNIVLEQYDHMGPDITSNMTEGFYHMQSRNSFVGIKL
jgi:SAM-dependent methyltransferase